jgi:hypothetical protein
MSSWQPKLWKRFLYHYTRACPGPWPDQHYRDYLLRLLTGDPLSGHTALDTLIHIILEGRLRASSKLIRGSHQTLSLTSLPPPELEKIRQWNPALIRWTFEPYGMALSREILKSLGARPTIYAGERAYQRIKSRDRFRFQRHEPPGCSWKHEREWRLPKDFDLDQVAPEEGFLFVDTRADAEAIAINTQSPMPIVILSELGKRPV